MLYPSPSLCIVPTLHRLITTCKQLMYIMNFVRSHSKQTGMHEHKMIKTNRGIELYDIDTWGELLIKNNAAIQHEMPNMQQRTLL